MYNVAIIGAGPAGIFSALEIVKLKPDWKVILIEKGQKVGLITIIRGVFPIKMPQEIQRQIMQDFVNEYFGAKSHETYETFAKDNSFYSFVIIEGINNISFNQITKTYPNLNETE